MGITCIENVMSEYKSNKRKREALLQYLKRKGRVLLPQLLDYHPRMFNCAESTERCNWGRDVSITCAMHNAYYHKTDRGQFSYFFSSLE